MASNLNRFFVYVPSANVELYKNDIGKTNSYKSKIAFLSGTGEIMTRGEVFAINKDSDLTDLKTTIGANSSNLVEKLGFDADDIIDAIKFVYSESERITDELSGRLDIIEGDADVDGSIKNAVSDTISRIVNNAPEAFDTLKEIAEWIADDNVNAVNLITRVNNLESQVEENEEVTATALIDLQQQINELNDGLENVNSIQMWESFTKD